MALPDLDHGVSYSFSVTIDGVQLPHIIDVSGLKVEVDKIEHKSNDASGAYLVRYVAGRKKGAEVKFTRAITDSTAISDWFGTVHKGDMAGARKTAEVAILDYEGAPIKKYTLSNAWVKSFEIGTLKAGATEPLTETFVVSCDDIEVSS